MTLCETGGGFTCFRHVSIEASDGAPVAERRTVVETKTPRAFVRVLGVRRRSFVEFSFALGDPDLSVDLVLPLAAFLELRDRYAAETLTASADAAAAFGELMIGRNER